MLGERERACWDELNAGNYSPRPCHWVNTQWTKKRSEGEKKGWKERRKRRGGLWVRSREQSAHKGTLRGGLRRSRMRSATLLGLGLEWGREGRRERGGQNGISQRALENPAEHLNGPREGGGRRGWAEGEWPAFWDQFVSFLPPIPPASVLTDVQKRTRAETLVYAHPLAAVTPVRRVNQTNTTILWFTSWRERVAERWRQTERGRAKCLVTYPV